MNKTWKKRVAVCWSVWIFILVSGCSKETSEPDSRDKDQIFIEELRTDGFEDFTIDQLLEAFGAQCEKSETFYETANNAGYSALYEESEPDQLHLALYFTAIDKYEKVTGDDSGSGFSWSYMNTFGNFDGGEEGAVAVVISWDVRVNIDDLSEVTVGERSRAVLRIRDGMDAVLGELAKEEWLEQGSKERVKGVLGDLAGQISTGSIVFSIEAFDWYVAVM